MIFLQVSKYSREYFIYSLEVTFQGHYHITLFPCKLFKENYLLLHKAIIGTTWKINPWGYKIKEESTNNNSVITKLFFFKQGIMLCMSPPVIFSYIEPLSIYSITVKYKNILKIYHHDHYFLDFLSFSVLISHFSHTFHHEFD